LQQGFMSSGLPSEVVSFLRSHITSIEQLELLMLLRHQPAGITVEDATRALASSEQSILKRAHSLIASGLVRSEGVGAKAILAYAAVDAIAATVDTVLATYIQRRLTVIETIYGCVDDELKQLSDAFKLRKDPS
jgi:hypothetical protein